MSSAYSLHALRTLLAKPDPTVGVVVRVTATQVEVATVQGLISARAAGGLQPGQPVTLQHGMARARAPTRAVYPL